MKPQTLTVSAVIPATPEAIYQAWLNGKQHAAMTGAAARIDGRKGGSFEVWDGYATGTTLEAVPARRILQSWRTSEFPAEAPDSLLEVKLTRSPRGTRITLRHSGIPAGQAPSYRDGWKQYYFVPMREHFAKAQSTRSPRKSR